MTLGKQADITLFLLHFKMTAQVRFTLIPRGKNLSTITQYGIKPDEIKNVIFQLTLHDYISGPCPDHTNSGYNVWVFGVQIGEAEFYVKLSDDFRGNEAKCLSFHKADYKCTYPHKKQK